MKKLFFLVNLVDFFLLYCLVVVVVVREVGYEVYVVILDSKSV